MPHILYPGRRFAAFLFDMDGTLINSIASANRTWTRWARAHGVDPEYLLGVLHGVRTVETIRRLNLPGVDPEREAAAITRAEIADVADVVPIAGAPAFLAALPADRWAIVTSATRDLALGRLGAAGIAPPRIFITAEDVAHGKPAPDCYLLAAKQLGVSAADCLVWEDTLAGVGAADACKAAAVVISETHAHPIDTQHPHVVNYEGLTVRVDASGSLSV